LRRSKGSPNSGNSSVIPHRVDERIAFVMSGGRISPSSRAATSLGANPTAFPGHALASGLRKTRDFLPEELGRGVQIEETAEAVATAMADAAIVDPQDVHFVQIKCAF
jgi:cyanuric acid amidohydrolase